jgi:superfamily I DNA/RNA helicase
MPWNANVRGQQVRPLINLDDETIRVEAGPGAGKTFGLVRRIHRILHPDGLAAAGADVLVVAFNRVIAKQLRADITEELTQFQHNGDPIIRTIHALCIEVIGGDLRLLLPHERDAMIYDILHLFPAVRAEFDRVEDADQALKDHEARNADYPALWQASRNWLERHQARLISDLPGLLLDRLQGGDFRERVYQHVIVDEFQDLTPGEQQLMFRLRRGGGHLVALGDRRQSIYRFRGNDRLGLENLEQLAGAGNAVTDVPMTECQRCPAPIVQAANRLMVLAAAEAMVPANAGPANLHVVTWPDPAAEAVGMARAIVDNIAAHPDDKHLVMVTRRQFGYALRTEIAALNDQLKVDLSFSEGLLESWAAREAFLLFCLLVDPDRPTWRAWFAYRDSADGRNFKAPSRNAAAYLQMLDAAHDQITAPIVEALAQEPRDQRRGAGGAILWDRALRFVALSNAFAIGAAADAAAVLRNIFDPAHWIGDGYENADAARLDLELLAAKAEALRAEEAERMPHAAAADHLREVARRLRQHIATSEPLNDDGESDLQVCTLWGAKGVTADHVYILGVCGEAIPGQRRPEYPGTELDYSEEQRRLFYVSITRSKRTLVLSRALRIRRGEAQQLGLAVGAAGGRFWATLQMSPFLRDILPVLPAAVAGDQWGGCA